MEKTAKEPYKNAPITEALFDIHVSYDSPLKEEDFVRFGQRIKAAFPKNQKLLTREFKIELAPADPSKDKIGGAQSILAHNVESIGCRYDSEDKKRVIQIPKEAFAFSHLKPYPGWEAVISELDDCYLKFNEELKPKKIKRVVLKYINTFDFPADEIDEHINIKPMIGTGNYSFLITGASLKLNMSSPELNSLGEINLLLQPKLKDGRNFLDVTYDIVVYRDTEIAPSDVVTLKNTLEDLRKFKNDIFEANITDKTRELFA